MLLHKIANRTCSHCRALTNHYVMYAAAEVEKIKCESGDEIWRETGERIRAFAYCENCSQPSMFVLCPRESYSNASGREQTCSADCNFHNRQTLLCALLSLAIFHHRSRILFFPLLLPHTSRNGL